MFFVFVLMVVEGKQYSGTPAANAVYTSSCYVVKVLSTLS